MVLSHPYMEYYVLLPTRSGVRTESRLADRDINHKKVGENCTLSRWCAGRWIDLLVEKHAWLSAGHTWLPEASESGWKALFDEESSGKLESMPTINIFEHWEEGAQFAQINGSEVSLF